MEGGQHHHVLLLFPFADGREQGDVLRDFQQTLDLGLRGRACRILNLAACALGHPVAELQHVAPARSGHRLAVFRVVQILLVADFFEPIDQKSARSLGPQRMAGAVFQVVDIAAKLQQALKGLFGQRVFEHGVEQRAEHGQLVGARKLAQLAQRGVTDAALGRANGAQKRRVVVVVDPQPEPGAQVLDFSTVKERGATRDLVRNTGLAQRFFKRLGLVVGAVQNRHVLPGRLRIGRSTQALDAGHSAFGLMFFGVAIDNAHRLAFAQF